MKKILILLMVLACFTGTAYAALTYGQSNYDKHIGARGTKGQNDPLRNFINEVEDMLDGTGSTTITNLLFAQVTSDPTATEGRLYYNATSEVFRYRKSGSWANLAAESGTVSLDVAYNNGNSIDVDGSAVTLTTSDTDNNVVLAIVQNEGTNNNDGVTIAQTGSGDALQISPQDVDSGGLNMISVASSTVPLVIIDGSTNNWDGADNKGQILIQTDDPFIHAGATALMVLDSSTPITAAEGFLARFVHSGTARTNSSAVEIEVPATQPALAMNGILAVSGQNAAGAALVQIANVAGSGNADGMTITSTGSGDALQITVGENDGVAQRNIAAASQTTSLAVFDGATSNWDGADNIGMVHITTDDPLVDTGASLLNVTQSGQAIASAEGFLARFIASGTARTDATAVEIEVAATQPALAVNGITKINGQNAAGATLFQVAGVGASGNADAMLISNTGSGNCLQVTPGETDSGGINVTSLASSTVSMITLDGATNNWDGADNIGQLTLTQDDAVVHTGATQLMVHNTGTTVASAEGFLARFVQDTGAAVTTAHAVEIETTNTTPALKLNNKLTITGVDSTGVLVAITGDDDTGDTDIMTISNGAASDAIQITNSDVSGTGLNVIATASQITSSVIIDGASNNWDGADNLGMLHLTADDAAIHTGASMLVLRNTGTVIAAAEGFLARFIQDTGAAVTDAYAVEIEVTATTPCLKLNGQMTIAGQGATDGVLLDITSADTNDDAVQFTGVGSADVLQVTADATTATAIRAIGKANATVSLAVLDGTTGDWLGASDVGMLHLTSDGALASVNSSLLYIAPSGVPQNDTRGSAIRIVDTGTPAAGTAGYSVYIAASNGTQEALYVDAGKVQIDEILTTGIGYQSTVVTKIAHTDGGSGSTIAAGTRVVHVTGFTANANDWILLPSGTIGERLTIISDVAHEIRTPAASDDTINDVDADGGAAEYAVVLDDINDFVCTGTGASWIAVAHDKLGAAKTIAPD